MATTIEELQLKLGIDQSQVGPDLDKFKSRVTEATGHAHKGFLHVESAGRAFHKVIHQITEQSPLMGSALRFALSPITGTLMAATAAFAYLNSKIEETNKDLDRMAEINAKPIADIRDAARQAAVDVGKLNREMAREGRKYDMSEEERRKKASFDLDMEQMDSRARAAKKLLDINKDLALSKVAQQERTGAISQEEAIRRRNQIEAGYAQQSRQADIDAESRKVGLLQTERAKMLPTLNAAIAASEQANRVAANPFTAGQIAKDKASLAGLEAQLEQAKQKEATALAWTNQVSGRKWYEIGGMAGDAMKYALGGSVDPVEAHKKAVAERRTLEANIARARSMTEGRDVVAERAKTDAADMQERMKSLQERFDDLGNSVEKSKLKIDELKSIPATVQQAALEATGRQYLPTIDQLAGMGQWRMNQRTHRFQRVESPAMRAAREIESLGNDALQSAAWGNMDRHNADVNRINDLKNSLASSGVIDPGAAAQKSEEHLASIASTIKGGAMTVSVTNTD